MNKKTISGLSVLFCVLQLAMVICIAFSIIAAEKTGDYGVSYYVSAICLTFALLFGIYYILVGCKKELGGSLYVWFMGALIVCDLLLQFSIARSGAEVTSAFSMVILSVGIGATSILCFAKDLGSKKSYILAIVGLVAKIVVLALSFTNEVKLYTTVAASLLLSITAIFMVAAKYYDKAERKGVKE